MKWILSILFGGKSLPAPELRCVVQNDAPRLLVRRTA